VIIEIIVIENLFVLLMCLLTFIEHFEDLFDETLNVMRPTTLKITFVDLKTKNDCR